MDTFLSHDWGTSRWQKLTMLVLFNSRAAAVASCFTCCVCMVPAMMFPWLAWWFAIPGYVVFVGLLFFWQRIRALLCGPKLVFLDRLCISQHDDHSVVAEVLLSCLVLFELASFFRQDSGKLLRLMPTSLGTMCFVMWCGGGSCAVAYVITKYAFPKLVSDPTNPPSWILLLETQTLFIHRHDYRNDLIQLYASSLMTAIRALPSQLQRPQGSVRAHDPVRPRVGFQHH